MMIAYISAGLKNDNEFLLKLTEIKKLMFSKYKISHSVIRLVPSNIEKELQEVCRHCS